MTNFRGLNVSLFLVIVLAALANHIFGRIVPLMVSSQSSSSLSRAANFAEDSYKGASPSKSNGTGKDDPLV